MTRSSAAVRGSIAAVFWGSVLVGFLWLWRATHEEHAGLVSAVADILLDTKLSGFGGGRVHAIAAALAAAALTGAAMSLWARRVGGPRWRRILLLSLASLPALYLVVVVALVLLWAPQFAADGPWWSAAYAPVGALLYGLVGVVMFAPVGALPAIGAAITIERLIPMEQEPAERRLTTPSRTTAPVIWVLVVLGTALATSVALRLLMQR